MNLVYSGLSAQDVSNLVVGVTPVVNVTFCVVLLLFGAYGLYGVYRLKKEQYLIPHRLMYPNYCSHEDCTDPVEYMDYIFPRLAILSSVLELSGILLLMSFLIDAIRTLTMTLVLCIVPLVVYLWYNGCLKRAAKKYWE